jgi:hypothetical protein
MKIKLITFALVVGTKSLTCFQKMNYLKDIK